MTNKPWLVSLIFLNMTSLAISQYEANYCSAKGNYTSESLYRADLKGLLGEISSNIMGNDGFYSTTRGGVNAIALCRADIQLNQCRGCIDIAAEQILQSCPNQIEAIMWYQYCMIGYSNQSISGAVEFSIPGMLLMNTANVTSPERFMEVLGELLDELRGEAANGTSLRKAAAGNRSGPDGQTIYALLQCTPDLSPQNCASCLLRAARYIEGYTRKGFRVYTPNCLIRYESDPFYNITRLQEPLAPSSPPAGKNNDKKAQNTIIIVVTIFGCLLLALCIGIFARKRMKQKTIENPDNDEVSTVESIQYDFDKIRAATNNFSDANKLGQGGFGAVYKGKLVNGREIAVKRLSKNSGQGDLEFKNEVLLLARLQHRNLVRLVGFSVEVTERLLIYEFVSNGSLDHFIFDPIKSPNLDWEMRYKIICGTARGLLYLHEDSRLRIIHRDLKASNVLLDADMNPKISDFGMAKLLFPGETQESTSRIVGTYGYMAPEYALHGHISVKSDVYSFGVLVLEIVSNQKKIFVQNGENLGDLTSYAWRSWREGTSANMIDPILRDTCGSQPDMLRCIHIALLCVQENAVSRPTMATVVVMLNSSSLTLPRPSEPAFYFSGTEISNQMQPSSSTKGLIVEFAHLSNNEYPSITNLYPR